METTEAAVIVALCALGFGMATLIWTGVEVGIDWYREARANRGAR
jgi:hypothetical protein